MRGIIDTSTALKTLESFDKRLLKQTRNCHGSAVIRDKTGKWRLGIFLKEQVYNSEGKSIHDHLLNLRFGPFGARTIKNTKETYENELTPMLLEGTFKFCSERTELQRPAPGGVSIGHIDTYMTAGTLGCIVYKPVTPVYNYVVAGTVNPDCTGNYKLKGIYNGENFYQPDTGDWFLWWDIDVEQWVISSGLGLYDDLEITCAGTPVPDCRGRYHRQGLYDEADFYKHESKSYYIWRRVDSPMGWVITDLLGDDSTVCWYRNGGLEGDYVPETGVGGTVTVDSIGDKYVWRGEGEVVGTYVPDSGGVTGDAAVSLYQTPANLRWDRFILSNNHVLAAGGEIGSPICQPGLYDIFEHAPPYSTEERNDAIEHYQIGHLEEAVPMWWGYEDGPYNHVDAALCHPIDFYVSGTLNPDYTGGYYKAAWTYNNKSCYYHNSEQYIIWWHKSWKRWVITDELGNVSSICWKRTGSEIVGDYEPITGVTGTASVSKGALDRIIDLGLTGTVKMPEVNEEVIKVGRSSGKTMGMIIGISGVIDVDGAYFNKQILTEYIGGSGDSGSLLISACGKRAVGLLMAGSEEMSIMAYNPAICIEIELGVTFAKPKRFSLGETSRLIYGKTISTLRKICSSCQCVVNWAVTLCRPPFTYQMPIYGSDPPECEERGYTYRRECFLASPYESCATEPAGSGSCEPPDIPDTIYDICLWGTGYCYWDYSYYGGPVEEECSLYETPKQCYAVYTYNSNECQASMSLCQDYE